MVHRSDLISLDPSALSIAEIRERLFRCSGPLPGRLLSALKKDRREGVRRIYRQAKRRQEKEGRERRRSKEMQRREQGLWNSGVQRVAGVDEVGIGPLAGPVVAASVVFAPHTMIPGVDDSKRVRPQERERLARTIRREAVGVGVGVVQVEEIEQLNVYNAGVLAMRRAVEGLPVAPEHLLLDARRIPEVSIPQSSFIKGDRLSFSIAAASIIAKTYRDQLMVELDQIYPRYGFAQHKGYSTGEHMKAIEQYGPCPVHRKSFAFIQELCGEYSDLFYQLRKRLVEADTPAEICAFQGELHDLRPDLTSAERRKIALLLGRRRERLQPTLFRLK